MRASFICLRIYALAVARWFQAASPATVQVWVVPHAGHTQGLATAPQAWETHVISFLNAALKPHP